MKPLRIAALFSLAAIAAAATSAPVRAQRLATPIPSPVTKTSAKKAEPLTGFQDVKWGDSIAKATKTLQAKGATVEKNVGSDNTVRVSNLKVAGYETQLIKLRFGSDGFYQANVDFASPRTQEGVNQLGDIQQIITERFGEAMPSRSAGGFGGLGGYANLGEWRSDLPNKETATLKLTANQSAMAFLEYRSTERAEREEARIRAEKAKSL